MTHVPMVLARRLGLRLVLAAAALATGASAGQAESSLVADLDSGAVLYQDHGSDPAFPASTTKLMTVYVALSVVRAGRITFDTPMMVSGRAAKMPPAKMGFKPGTLVTLGNALKMLLVKSPNDIAVTIAEGVSGSVEAFAGEMNQAAARLGLHESHFVNPNGLPDPSHVSSARDMAIITRALLHDFPDQRPLFGIEALSYDGRQIDNLNTLLGRYPGVFGMKTGFTCAAGHNLVATAEADGRRLAVVVLGAPSTEERDLRVALLFDRFLPGGGAAEATLADLPASALKAAPDNHDTSCGPGHRVAVDDAEQADAWFANGGQPVPLGEWPHTLMAAGRSDVVPVVVKTGPVPGWKGRVARATPVPRGKDHPAATTPGTHKTVGPAPGRPTASR